MLPPRRIALVFCSQLFLFSATWVAGIYVNGFVAIFPGTSTEAILLDPPVTAHVVLASLTLATSVVMLVMVATSGERRSTLLACLTLTSVVVAGVSGLSFVLGGASDSWDSMAMAGGFITALFLSFLTFALLRGALSGIPTEGKWTTIVALVTLLLCYCVFVTGVYINLFVTGPVFSLPLAFELSAFRQAELSWPFVLHELLGGALLLSLATLALSLGLGGARRLSLVAWLGFLLVAYSAFVGSLNLASPLSPTPPGLLSVLVPMLSATAFVAAIVVTMLLTLSLRAPSGSHSHEKP